MVSLFYTLLLEQRFELMVNGKLHAEGSHTRQ
jgi:hypothetical protein